MLWQLHQKLELNQFLAQIPRELAGSAEIKLALRIIDTYYNGNYKRMMDLVRAAPFLFASACMNGINKARVEFLERMIRVTNNNFSISLREVREALLFNNDDETAEFCDCFSELSEKPMPGPDTYMTMKHIDRADYKHWTPAVCAVIEQKIGSSSRAEIIKTGGLSGLSRQAAPIGIIETSTLPPR